MTRTYPAEVTNVMDPEKLGRIKVKCPGLVRADRELPMWVAPMFPFVSKQAAGWFFVPKVGTQVEIEVTTGAPGDQTRGEASLSAPNAKYRAGLYNSAQQVPDIFKESYPNRRGLRTPSGHVFMLDDTDGQEELLLQDKSGNALLMTTSSLKLYDANGFYIEFKSSGLVLEASGIKVGAGATEHLVKGESLVNWITATLKLIFDTHTHPGVMVGPGTTGVPLVPLTVPPSSMLSATHTVE